MGKVIKIKDRRAININIGYVILGVIFVYMIICTIIYMTKKKVTVYEVNAGSIADTTTYSGFILRQEDTVTSEYSGNINYCVFEKERVNFGANICCIDNTGILSDYIENLKSNKTSFEEDDIAKINNLVSSHKVNYTAGEFSQIYAFKNDLNNAIETYLNENVLNDLNSYVENNPGSCNLISTDKTGVVVYGYDGYEDFDANNLTYDMYNLENYSYTNLISRDEIVAGETAYKIVTSQEWDIYIKLSDEMAKRLSQQSVIEIKFVDSNISTNADFAIFSNQYGVYGKISLNKYINDYATDRFVDIEIMASNTSGLKIPKTSIVEKDFYKIPKAYVINGNEDSDELGVLVSTKLDNGEESGKFVAVDIYDEDDENYYIDNSVFDSDDKIIAEHSQAFFELAETKKVKGVYRVNKGYAVFRKVEILDENEDFYIISDRTTYGLSVYDRIVYDSSKVKEDEILY